MISDFERFNKLLRLNPETGYLYWKVKKKGRRNKRAGTLFPSGYRMLMLDGTRYLEHRVVLLLVNGYWPDITDHINRKKADNRPVNLRDVGRRENALNTRRHPPIKMEQINERII